MSWAEFAAVFIAFFLTHSLPVRPRVKSRVVAVIGTRGFGLAYSALSLGMLWLLIWSAGEAPYLQLWPQMSWQRHVTHLGMLSVCLLLAFSLGRPNPFSFGGARNHAFDPARPGLVAWTRHPVLVALAIWAGVHLLPNGDLAHVILFGTLGAFALLGRALIDRRKRQRLGATRWHDLNSARRRAPKFHRPESWAFFGLRALIGFGAFAALIWAHPYIIGVPAV